MLSTTRIVSRASDHISPPARSAVARFFDTSELVLMLLEHLHQYRIDLLVVAAVCKQLRPLALQAWMWHFDFGYKSFEGKLKLVQANYWSKVELLLSLLAAHTSPSAQGPLLDILIHTDDGENLLRALQPYPKIIKRIAALRLFDLSQRPSNRYVEDNDENQNTSSTGGWTGLALLLNEAFSQKQSVSALRVLDYKSYVNPTTVDEAGRAVRLNFWSILTAHAWLHGLRLYFQVDDPATYLLRHGSFPSLKNFEFNPMSLREEPELNLIVDAFLHRHTGLRRLFLDVRRRASAPLFLDHTFPALRTLELDYETSVSLSSESALDFLRRHPGIRQTTVVRKGDGEERSPLHSLLSANAQMYKHLSVPANATPNELNDLVKSGARPLRARVSLTESPPESSFNNEDTRFVDLGFKDWYGIRPEHVKDLTYLQIICGKVTLPSLIRSYHQLFASDLFPALTELYVQDITAYDEDCKSINDLLIQLTAATSLCVLCIYDNDPSVAKLELEWRAWGPTRILAVLPINHLFPARFELLCWKQRWGKTTYFRFVGDDPEMQDLASTVAAPSGKFGRLQVVPNRTVLVQVSKGGVWHDKRGNPWKNTRNLFNTPLIFLDHKGAASPMTR